jgi:hypothetical protein
MPSATFDFRPADAAISAIARTPSLFLGVLRCTWKTNNRTSALGLKIPRGQSDRLCRSKYFGNEYYKQLIGK